MPKKHLIIATRKSKLALWQANFVREQLIKAHPTLEVSLLGITTSGDNWLSSPLAEIGGKGLFVKELELAMLEGRADIAVHSLKDVPSVLPDQFEMPVIGFREDPRDALVSLDSHILSSLPYGARVGSSSERRHAQIKIARPDLIFVPIRGNIETRLRKLESENYDALILASAGLHRLGLSNRISEYQDVDTCLPAAGQGALGVECRRGDKTTLSFLAPLKEQNSLEQITAERMVAEKLGVDCSVPLGVFATLEEKSIFLRVFLGIPGGPVFRAQCRGKTASAVSDKVVEELLGMGANSVIASFKSGKPR